MTSSLRRRAPLLACLALAAAATTAPSLAGVRPAEAPEGLRRGEPTVDLDAYEDALARAEAAGDPRVQIHAVEETQLAYDASGAVTFEQPGLFLDAERGASYVAYDLPVQNNYRYRRASVEFDLFLNRWQSDYFHSVFGLRRTGATRRDRTLYVGLILRGSKGFKSILDIGVNPRNRVGEIIRSETGPWRERSEFHVRIDYDTVARRTVLQVWEDGELVQVLAGRINNTDLTAFGGRKLRVDFGSLGVGDGAYFPPYGWRYSNLTVNLAP